MRLIFSLALRMGCTVRELLERLDAREFLQWLAYHQIDPWDEERADWRAGMVAAVIANTNGGRGKFRPSDFMPKFDQVTADPQTPEQMLRIAMRANAALGGEVK